MAVDYNVASSLNPFFARSTLPPWGQRIGPVLSVIGLGSASPSLGVFADAVHAWEQAHNASTPNGILDHQTWKLMEPTTRICVGPPSIPLAWIAPIADAVEIDDRNAVNPPMSGFIPVSIGLSTVLRIPVPGTNNLAIEFFPRSFKGESTSTAFIQNMKGNKTLRLDYGFNKVTGTIDYHWNQKGTHAKFGITDHQPVGKAGKVVYQSAKYFRYAGRVLVVLGAVMDTFTFVTSSKPLRTATAKVSAWALAAAGCKAGGVLGAKVGSIKPGLGTIIGGVTGCIVGGGIGYLGGERLGEEVYDWAEGTVFTPASEVVP